MNLFTYGTLMFPEVWQTVVGRDFASLPATLRGHQIFRVAGAVYPGIIKLSPPPSPFPPPPSTPVPGILYLNLDDESLTHLDQFESDFYQRRPITVTADDGQLLAAEAYVVPEESRHLLTDEVWTAEGFQSRGDLARFVARYAGFDRLG
jgi:gamma-glutamylcyclotransferase (GGCT)/AIG2-like uncharacterized protein YtfP